MMRQAPLHFIQKHISTVVLSAEGTGRICAPGLASTAASSASRAPSVFGPARLLSPHASSIRPIVYFNPLRASSSAARVLSRFPASRASACTPKSLPRPIVSLAQPQRFFADPLLIIGSGARAKSYIIRPWWKRLLRFLGATASVAAAITASYVCYVYWSPARFWAYWLAAVAGDRSWVERLHGWGLSPAVVGYGGTTPLHIAADFCDTPDGVALLQALVAAGADPNATTTTGETPLLVTIRSAARRASLDPPPVDAAAAPVRAARALATPAAAAIDPVHLAEAVQTLLRAGADPAATLPSGATALHPLAVMPVAVASLALLAEAGAPLEARDKQGWCALHYAVAANNAAAVRALARAGADLDVPLPSEGGATPLQLASRLRAPAAAAALVAEGADVGEATELGTPLYHALAAGDALAAGAIARAGGKLTRSEATLVPRFATTANTAAAAGLARSNSQRSPGSAGSAPAAQDDVDGDSQPLPAIAAAYSHSQRPFATATPVTTVSTGIEGRVPLRLEGQPEPVSLSSGSAAAAAAAAAAVSERSPDAQRNDRARALRMHLAAAAAEEEDDEEEAWRRRANSAAARAQAAGTGASSWGLGWLWGSSNSSSHNAASAVPLATKKPASASGDWNDLVADDEAAVAAAAELTRAYAVSPSAPHSGSSVSLDALPPTGSIKARGAGADAAVSRTAARAVYRPRYPQQQQQQLGQGQQDDEQ